MVFFPKPPPTVSCITQADAILCAPLPLMPYVTIPAPHPLDVEHFNFQSGKRTHCPVQPKNTEYIISILHLHFNIPTDTNKQAHMQYAVRF